MDLEKSKLIALSNNETNKKLYTLDNGNIILIYYTNYLLLL